MLMFADLRDDKQFFVDHPSAAPISAAQVNLLASYAMFNLFPISQYTACQHASYGLLMVLKVVFLML